MIKGKKGLWIAYPNGTCEVTGVLYWSWRYQLACELVFDNWGGLPYVTAHTMIGYEPRAYELLMMIIGGACVLIVSLALLALVLKRLPWNLKVYLLGGLLLGLFKGLQMFYQVTCSKSLKPFMSLENSTRRFPCLDRSTNGFYWNQMISSYGMAVLPVYRVLIWSMIVSRFISMRRTDWFNPLRVSYLQVTVCLIGLPWFFLAEIGTMHFKTAKFAGGVYFHPLTFQVREHWPFDSALATKAPAVNAISFVIDVFALAIAHLTMRMLRNTEVESRERTLVEIRLQKMISVIHAVLIMAWLLDLAYFKLVFAGNDAISQPSPKAEMFAFVLENLPGWIVATILPLLILGYCIQRDPKVVQKSDNA